MIGFIQIVQASEKAAEVAAEAEKTGIAGTLGLNWFSFIAQLVNFAIVLFILWKYVLGPVAKKLTERAEKIEKAMRDAESTEKEKQEFEVWKNAEMSKARQEASGIITKSQTEAAKVKDEILAQAKTEQQKLVEQAKKQIESEKQQALMSAKGELADLVTMATEKILRQKLDGKKDAELVKESLKDIK